MNQDQIYALKYRFFTVGAIGTYMATLDGSILVVALPTIAESFGVSVDIVAWVALAYSLTLISLMLVFGAWVQKRGYYFGYRFGYIFFMIGSGLCALSPTIYFLIFARVVQAVGTAMFAALGPGMVTTVFPAAERGKGIGLMVMMVSAGFMSGPVLGGVILGLWSWHLIFLINLPVGAVGLYLVIRYFRSLATPDYGQKLRLYGPIAMSSSLVLLVFAMKMANQWGIGDYRIWVLAALGVVGMALFFRFESDPTKAMIGLGIFRNRQFTTAIGAQQAHFMSLSGVLLLVPFYLERVMGMEPSTYWVFLLILPVLMLVLAPLAGGLSDRIGYRYLTAFGMVSLATGMFLLSRLGLESGTWDIVAGLVVVGVGVGCFSSPNSSAMMGSVTEEQRAITSSILATNRNIGHAVGVAVATALFSYFQMQQPEVTDERLAFLAGFEPVLFVGMLFAGVGFLLSITRPEPAAK